MATYAPTRALPLSPSSPLDPTTERPPDGWKNPRAGSPPCRVSQTNKQLTGRGTNSALLETSNIRPQPLGSIDLIRGAQELKIEGEQKNRFHF